MTFQDPPLNRSDTSPVIQDGVCYAVFAYDVGIAIRLDEAEALIPTTKARGRIKRQQPAPQYFDYDPPPLRITGEAPVMTVGPFETQPHAEAVLYDFGAIMMVYQIGFQGPLSAVQSLSEALYEHPSLLSESQRHVSSLLTTVGAAIEKPFLSPFVEDYSIFHVVATSPTLPPLEFLAANQDRVAQILRSEDEPLSPQEIHDATGAPIAFGHHDLTLIDWNAAMMIGPEMDDVRAVLEFVNVELVERRFLDHQLDQALDEAYASLTSQSWYAIRWPGSLSANLRRIAGLQVDSAILFERVTNTLKLFGDQYLARVYRLASQRFYLQSWDTSVVRKLETLDNLYGKMADHTGNRRMEILEWIIIVLIAISILLPFIPGFPGY